MTYNNITKKLKRKKKKITIDMFLSLQGNKFIILNNKVAKNDNFILNPIV